jgi:hypothetical protein
MAIAIGVESESILKTAEQCLDTQTDIPIKPKRKMATHNFQFLKERPCIFQLAFAAEQSFSADPNTTLIKLRQLGEAFAQDMAASCGIDFDEKPLKLTCCSS